MIPEFVRRFDAKREVLRSRFGEKRVEGYIDIVRMVVEAVSDGGYGDPDPENIHEIDDGSYQGTLVYVIPEAGYEPSDYWYVRVEYGSCSGCDTLQAIQGYGDEVPDKELDDTMTLALHILQRMKKMDDEES